ncbi:SapC family protein [Microbulbifer agarilyticus]|uniref:SapC family protein n=1 Tax=Microbulbifer agarilyticus TaxID=260552 RepID=UPI001C985477|nr:SapC family protein [Microbulbifer agarilyticus]MBY6191754.1 SapC family protein [Microbulbifer agarilyticus]MBY6212942.1 SapC family protein [Microbulbifer agarilyticus]
MSELLFYRKPVALNRENHRNLKFTPANKFLFSREINSVPLTGIEFFEASRDLPIFFSHNESGQYFPLALLSLRNNQHALVDDDGSWQGSYVPAFIRRYPFAMTDNQTVCFDEGCEQFSEEAGEPLFDEQGENSETLNNVLQFLTNFDKSYKATQEFTAALAEHKLFKAFDMQVMAGDGKPVRLEGLHVVDEAKLLEVEPEQVQSWFKSGQLAWIYAHLHSLGALRQLSKQQAQANAVAEAKEKAEAGALN